MRRWWPRSGSCSPRAPSTAKATARSGPGSASAGIRTSKRRVLRLTREHGLQAPGRVGRPHGPRAHDGTIRTERVDVMWGSDLTSTLTAEGQASIFVAVDHCSIECIGIHAARRATRFEALEPIRQGVRVCCAERFIRTLKENLLWVRGFDTIEELRQALHQFMETYNRTWIVERHGYRAPAQVRADQLGLAHAA